MMVVASGDNVTNNPYDSPTKAGQPEPRGGMTMDERELRMQTLCLACFSFACIVFFISVYAPGARSARPGASLRPMTIVTLLAAAFGSAGWIPAIVMGIRQLFRKPRRYGFLSIGVGIVHYGCFRAAQWLLMDIRGIHWGT
jgi:hypothetical protein